MLPFSDSIGRQGWLVALTGLLAACTIPSLQPDTTPVQQEDIPDPAYFICAMVETQPEFPGGHEAWLAYVKRNQRYPAEAARTGISGRVFVSFTVAETGQIHDVRVLKGLGYGCDEEAARLVRETPRWKPATRSGRAERVKFNIPVFFGRDN